MRISPEKEPFTLTVRNLASHSCSVADQSPLLTLRLKAMDCGCQY
jgi:hypothetical protein